MFEGFTPPQTPLLVIDRAKLEKNLSTMQRLCDAAGVRLRAHGKTHKCSRLGRMQVARGAVGLCAQTVGEAEAFVAGSIGDVLVTAPVAPWAAPRLAALAKKGAKIGVVADTEEQIARLGQAARSAGAVLDLVVDLDLGTHRTGAYPRDAVKLARATASTDGLNFAGVQAYLGHLQHVTEQSARKDADEEGIRALAQVVEDLRAANLAPGVVTGGGTGTHAFDLASGVFNELQAGSYAVMDVEYEACAAPGGEGWPFEPAMFVATSIVSAHHKTHATCDAGFKAMAVDGPPARVLAGAAEGSLWRPMGDEHGAIVHPFFVPALRAGGSDPITSAKAIELADGNADFAWPKDAPKPGDIVWLQPGHCDPTCNLYDAFHVIAADGSVERWAIDARRVSA
jgi:D-serine deaminase-like pyridoxal phosphate-dependent protein